MRSGLDALEAPTTSPLPARGGRSGRVWLWAAFLVVIGLVTVTAVEMKLRAPLPQRIVVQPVRQATFAQQVQGTGVVESQLISVTFPTPGRVKAVYVHAGQRVRQQQPLAALDNALLPSTLGTAQNTLADSEVRLQAEQARHQAALQGLQLQVHKALSDLGTARSLYAVGAIAQQDLVTAQDAVQQARLNIQQEDVTNRSTVAQLRQQQAASAQQLREAQVDAADDLLRSPVDGVIATVGLTPGVNSAATPVEIVKDHTAKVRVDLPEASSAGVRVGDVVQLVLSTDQQALTGVVDRVGVVATVSTSGNAVVPVYVRLPGGTPPLRSGLSVDASITTLTIPHALTVPLEAIVEDDPQTTATLGSAATWVWVVTPASTLQKRRVTVLARDVNDAAVQGLRPGERIARTPQDAFRDGLSVAEDHAP